MEDWSKRGDPSDHEFLIHFAWPGWPGTQGVPSFAASNNPVLGTTIALNIENSLGAVTTGCLLMGFEETKIPTNLGGTLLVDFFSFIFMSLPASNLDIYGTVPNDPGLCGVELFLQTLEMDPGAKDPILSGQACSWGLYPQPRAISSKNLRSRYV